MLWPTWEPARLRGEMRAAIAAHGRYACAEIAALLGEASAEAVETARRAAGVASNNAEASLQRALLEPTRADTGRLRAALTIDAALRRMAGRISALQVNAGRAPARPRGVAGLAASGSKPPARALAAGRSDLPPRPPLPQGDPDGKSLARIARQLDLAAGALARLDQPRAAS